MRPDINTGCVQIISVRPKLDPIGNKPRGPTQNVPSESKILMGSPAHLSIEINKPPKTNGYGLLNTWVATATGKG